MKSFNTLYSYAASITNNASSTTLTLLKQFINDSQRLLMQSFDLYTSEKSTTATTVASQQAYYLPADCYKLNDVTVAVGTYTYRPREITSRIDWDNINLQTFTSDYPSWYFVYNEQVLFYPTPSSNGNTITYNYKKKVKDMSAADYTTGTITTLANGGTAVTGSGTTWTAAMVGRYFKVDADGFWYEITAVGSATTLTIKRVYMGTSIAAGTSAYTIGEMPSVPEAYHEALALRAVALYFKQQNDLVRARTYEEMYDAEEAKMRADYSSKTTDVSVDSMGTSRQINPNWFPSSIG